jgi:DNA-binding FrmR family transcriptional regulator
MRPAVKKQVHDRLKRIEGQVRGVARMTDEDAYCIDVLTQLTSISSAIHGLGLLLLDDHVRTCVVDAIESGDGADELDELTQAIKRFVR